MIRVSRLADQWKRRRYVFRFPFSGSWRSLPRNIFLRARVVRGRALRRLPRRFRVAQERFWATTQGETYREIRRGGNAGVHVKQKLLGTNLDTGLKHVRPQLPISSCVLPSCAEKERWGNDRQGIPVLANPFAVAISAAVSALRIGEFS